MFDSYELRELGEVLISVSLFMTFFIAMLAPAVLLLHFDNINVLLIYLVYIPLSLFLGSYLKNKS